MTVDRQGLPDSSRVDAAGDIYKVSNAAKTALMGGKPLPVGTQRMGLFGLGGQASAADKTSAAAEQAARRAAEQEEKKRAAEAALAERKAQRERERARARERES